MNTDPRGVKRGNCLEENCDCSLYEYEEKNGAKCSYCCCPPTKHQKIDVPEENIEDHSVLNNSSFDNDGFQEKNGYVIQNLIPISSDVFYTSSCSSQLQDLLPRKLPRVVEEALEKKCMTPTLRNKIVRVIADKCFERGISSKEVNVVADLATQRWSPLKGRFGESSASLATQIKRRISKLKLHSKKSEDSEQNVEEEEMHSFNQQQMISEMGKKSPSVSKLKQFLDATREVRKDKVNHTPALQILVQYPALKISDLLLWEFTKIMKIEAEEMIVRWKNFLDSMKQYLLQTQNLVSLSESYEGLTLQILIRLPSIVPSGKRTGDLTKFVLQIYEENTALDEVRPSKSDPPRLIAIGDVTKSISLFAFVDGTAVFSEKCPIKAVLLLLATYWVFNIQFGAESRPAFQLISSAVLKEQMLGKEITKCSAAVDCLVKQLNL